jgi:hypothetical protein
MKLDSVEPVHSESRFNPVPYVLAGVLSGFLIGSAFAIAAAFVDRLLYPDLPLGIDWSLFTLLWGWLAPGLALVGAVAALFYEKLPSLILGALIAGLLALVSALYLSPVNTGMKVIVLIFAAVPMAVMSLPVVLILRWLADRQEHALAYKRYAMLLPLVALAIALGAGGGYFLKMSRRAVQATRFMHELVQTAPQEAESPIREVPGFESHMGREYRLFQQTSETSTEGFDVRAEYDDGYRLTCIVVVYPGRDPYLSDCTSSQE